MVNTIDTEIHLNGSQPVQTLKSLKSEVSSLTSAWKAEEIQLKSSGDSLQAAKAKYDGLSQAVNKQKDYIAKLKQEQGQIDQSTNRGAESYAKFGTQIENANRKLASMESQQTRAKDSWKYYESGVAESKKKLDEISASSEAYVKRLQAEGREQEANKAKLSALKSSYSEMQNLYSKQAGELDRIARESGKASDAYKKQEIRVNELGAKLATTKNDMTELSAATSKVKSSPFLRLKEALGGASKEAKEGATSFKSFLGATVIGNAVSNSISTFTSKAKEAFNVGMELNKTIGKIKATWVNMGKSDSDINNLINQMESLRIKTGYSADEVGTLQRSVDALTHGDTNKTLKITEGLSQVGLASKLSGEQVDALGKSFLRLASRDKINATAMAKIESIAPTISKALAGAAGVSEATFAKMVNDGQITGEKLQDLMVKASSQGENVFTTFAKSAGGAQVQIKRLWEDLSQRFSAPIFSVRATGLSDVAQILSSPVLKTAASTMGEGLKKIADYGISFLNYLNTHKAVLSGIVGDIWDITKTLASDVWKIFSDVFKNIVSSFNALSGNAVKSKDPLTQVKTLLDSISKNKEGIELVAKAVASLIAIKGITGFASKIANVAGSLKQISKTTIGSDGGTLGKLVGSGSSVKTAVSEGATATSKVGAVAGGLGVAVGAGFDLLGAIKAKNSDEKFKKYGSTLGDLIGGGIGLAFGGPAGAAIGGTIGHLLGDLGGKGAKGFMDGWTKVGKGQKPEGILQTIGFDAKKLLTQVTKTISSLTKPVTEAFKKVFSPVAKALKPVLTPMLKEFSSFSKSVDKALKPVSKVFSTVFKDVGKAIGPALKDVKSFIKDGLDVLGKAFQVTTKLISTVWNTAWGLMGKRLKEEWAIIGPTVKAGISVISKVLTATLRVISTVWLSTWNNLKTVVSGAWNIIKTTVKSALNVIKDIFKVVLDVLRGNWRAVWNDVKKIFSDVFNGIVSIAKSILGSLANVIKSAIDGIKSVWKSVWGSISDIFSSVMKGLRGIAVGAFNGVLGVINAAIGAINGVWHFFSGHNALNKLSYIKKAKGGTVGKEHLTMVNDGLGNDWKELIQRPNGELFMSQKKNEIMPLEEGTRVYNGFETKQIMQTFGIEHYAGGGIIGGIGKAVGGAIDWAKGTAEDVGKWIGDKWDAMTKFLKDPLGNVTKMISNAVSGMFDSLGSFGELAHGMIDKMLQPVADWFKSHLAPLKKKHDDEEKEKASTNAPTAGIAMGAEYWRPFVLQALQMNGLSESLAGVVLSQISTESGGNPHAINLWDSNALAGHPSKGLMQTIDSTFNAYAFPGHHDIWNGFDNILAALNYAKQRYGSNLAFLGHGHGYANGGIASTPSIFGEAGPEMAIPLDSLKSSRGYELLGRTMSIFASRDGLNKSASTDDSSLGDKLDTVITLLKQILLNDPAQTIDALAGKIDITTQVNLDGNKLARGISQPMQKILAKTMGQQKRGLNV